MLPIKITSKEDSFGQVVYYTAGWAYGIALNGETICLGTEAEVKAILTNPRYHPDNPTVAQVISLERDLTRQVNNEIARERAGEVRVKQERHRRAVEIGVARRIRKPREKKNRA